jgi:hypothetical protein
MRNLRKRGLPSIESEAARLSNQGIFKEEEARCVGRYFRNGQLYKAESASLSHTSWKEVRPPKRITESWRPCSSDIRQLFAVWCGYSTWRRRGVLIMLSNGWESVCKVSLYSSESCTFHANVLDRTRSKVKPSTYAQMLRYSENRSGNRSTPQRIKHTLRQNPNYQCLL